MSYFTNFRILKKMMHFKNQIDIKLVKHYKEIVSEVNINKSTINKLKIENDYYLNLTLHIINNNNYFVDIRLIEYVLLFIMYFNNLSMML